jgi:hypothetical protein
MRYFELLESFNPEKLYLHGGPSELKGGAFMRHGFKGQDMGALFFIEESKTGYKYALGYAISKYKDAGIWRVKINLSTNEVFDFTNRKHHEYAKENLNPAQFESWVKSAGASGHLDWPQIDEELMEEWGFKAVLLHERSAGFNNFDKHAISIAIFDPKHIEIVDFIPKKEALNLYGR